MSLFRKIGIVLIIALIIIGISFWQVIYPKVQEVNQLETKINNMQNELKKQGRYLKQKAQAKGKYPQYLEKLKQKQETALTVNQRDRLITDVNSIVNSDIKLANVSTANKMDTGMDNYIIYPTRIRLDGYYTGVTNFLEEITKLDYLIRLQRFRIKYNKETKKRPLDLEMKIYNYIQRPEEE